MEELKKRGRKKKVKEEIKEPEEEIKEPVEVVQKKRGRKKKWEAIPFKNNFFGETSDVIKFDDNNNTIIDESGYNTNKVKFGNLFIKIHDKQPEQISSLIENPTEKTIRKECLLNVSSDDEDEPIVHKESNKKKSLFIYNKEVFKAKCFNCHNFFDNSPFYLPFDYCATLDRYKIYGNFCSPNCVKSFSINSRHFQNKQHIVGQFYRKLFGANFRIKPAPSYLILKEYGGNLTIEEYRASFYKNKRYTLSNINCKTVKEEIVTLK